MRQKLLTVFLLFFLSMANSYGQSRQVQGKVTSAEDGRPLSGVSVTAGSSSTQTDASGDYVLAITGAVRLQFSYLGFINQDIVVADRSLINVRLVAEETAIEEVVVTGYGTLRKKEFTGASAQIKGAAIAERPLQSFSQGLTGQASGVHITQPNGLLNNPPVIRVRGLSSISLSSYPLVVIDGIPVTTADVSSNAVSNNPLGDINPADIESIDILKDAASAAIYGARAAAGVLVVTTKRGKAGPTQFNYNGWVGVTNAVRLPSLLNAQQYMDYKNQAILNALAVNPNLNPTSYPRDGGFFPSYDASGNLIDTRWYDHVYRSAISHNHDLSISGGNEKTAYYFSTGISDQDGFLRANNFKRKSGRFNISHQVTDWLKFNSNISFTNSINNAPNSGSTSESVFSSSGLGRIATAQAPNVAPYNEDGSYHMNGGVIGTGANVLFPSFSNPVALTDLDRNKSETNRLFASVGGELRLAEGLYFNSNFTWDLRNTDNNRFWNPIQGDGFGFNGHAFNNSVKADNWNFINTLRYQKSFDQHNFTALLGSDAQKRRTVGWGGQRQDIADDFFTQYQGSFIINSAAGNEIDDFATEAYFGSLNYNYAEKYFLSANLRRDGNSALSLNNKWGTFGGASAGWTISEENFFKESALTDLFSTLRLRGGWGRVGNGNLTNLYGAYNTYEAVVYGDVTSFIYNQAGNDQLRWETSSQINIGLDLSLFNNRLSADVNWYRKNIDNLILEVPQTPSKGIPGNTIPTNVGSMTNTGWEFTINALPVQNQNFQWNTSLNFSTNKNLVTSLFQENSPILGYTGALELTNITQVGSSAAQLYAVKTEGINPANGRRIFVNSAGERVQYLHLGGADAWTYLDGSRAASPSGDAQAAGNTLPTWFGGFNNTFRYKAFDAVLNFTYSGGNYIYNGTKAGLRDQRVWNNAVEVLNSWTPTNTDSDIPQAIYSDNISNGSAFAITENIEKGDFLRLQTASIGYKLPKSFFGNSGITNLRLYVSVNNVFVITKYSGVDPEIASNGDSNIGSGIERNSIPNGRTFTFGLNLGF